MYHPAVARRDHEPSNRATPALEEIQTAELMAAAATGVRIVTVVGGPLSTNAATGADVLLDYGGDLHARYGVGSAPALCLIRPDGYIGFWSEVDDAPELATYLRRSRTVK